MSNFLDVHVGLTREHGQRQTDVAVYVADFTSYLLLSLQPLFYVPHIL